MTCGRDIGIEPVRDRQGPSFSRCFQRAPPVAAPGRNSLRASQPSEGIILLNPSAYDATAAPGPDVWTDCNASVCGRRLRGHDFRRELLTRGA